MKARFQESRNWIKRILPRPDSPPPLHIFHSHSNQPTGHKWDLSLAPIGEGRKKGCSKDKGKGRTESWGHERRLRHSHRVSPNSCGPVRVCRVPNLLVIHNYLKAPIKTSALCLWKFKLQLCVKLSRNFLGYPALRNIPALSTDPMCSDLQSPCRPSIV